MKRALAGLAAGLVAFACVVRRPQTQLVADNASGALQKISIRDASAPGVKQLLALLPDSVAVEVDRRHHATVATRRYIFADINMGERTQVERELHASFAQTAIVLGDVLGDVPRERVSTYLTPIDDHMIAVGDPKLGAALAESTTVLDDVALQTRRFDRVAELLAARGFEVVRVPVLVLSDGSFVTYTDALFDQRDDHRIVYMPTYNQRALDDAAQSFYEQRGFEVHRIKGAFGGLVNVVARG